MFLLFSLILFFYLYSICFRSLPTFFNLDICCAEKNEKQRGMNKRQKRKVPATIFFLLVYFIFRFFFFFLHCSKRRWKSREGLGFGVHFLRIWEARITFGFVIIWISVFPFSLFRLALFYTCLHILFISLLSVRLIHLLLLLLLSCSASLYQLLQQSRLSSIYR